MALGCATLPKRVALIRLLVIDDFEALGQHAIVLVGCDPDVLLCCRQGLCLTRRADVEMRQRLRVTSMERAISLISRDSDHVQDEGISCCDDDDREDAALSLSTHRHGNESVCISGWLVIFLHRTGYSTCQSGDCR